MAKKHRIGRHKKKRKSGKMPAHVLAHFGAITLEQLRRRGITPKRMKTKKRRR